MAGGGFGGGAMLGDDGGVPDAGTVLLEAEAGTLTVAPALTPHLLGRLEVRLPYGL